MPSRAERGSRWLWPLEILLSPVGIAGAGTALLDLKPLAAGFGVALLSSAIPYFLEIEALRLLPASSGCSKSAFQNPRSGV